MTEPRQPERGLGPALKSFVGGAACCFVVFGLFRFVTLGSAVVGEWRLLLVMAVHAGLLFAIGQGIAGGTAGSLVGGVLGIFAGAALGLVLPFWTVPYVVEEKIEPGVEFDLRGPGLDGKTIDVKDYRGKVVLVDFWATWCVPCLHELPHVQDAYDKYHADGFDVIGVSLDNDREDLEAFLKSRKLPWKQIFIDKKGPNPLARQHGVTGIPATFLLDREGKVVAADVRGPEVAKEVGRLLGQVDEPSDTPGVRKRVRLIVVTPFISMFVCSITLALLGALLQRSFTPPGEAGRLPAAEQLAQAPRPADEGRFAPPDSGFKRDAP
jgi:thiol-disulfide isomerase/thioredoxin